jgi:hypothetical protein
MSLGLSVPDKMTEEDISRIDEAFKHTPDEFILLLILTEWFAAEMMNPEEYVFDKIPTALQTLLKMMDQNRYFLAKYATNYKTFINRLPEYGIAKNLNTQAQRIYDWIVKAKPHGLLTTFANEIMTPGNLGIKSISAGYSMPTKSTELWFEGKCVVVRESVFKQLVADFES